MFQLGEIRLWSRANEPKYALGYNLSKYAKKAYN